MKKMKRKLTSYQRLKLENDRLKEEIRLLIFKPDSVMSSLVKLKYKVTKNVEDAMWYGEISANTYENEKQ